VIRNPGNSNDDRAAIGIIRSMGAQIREEQDVLTIQVDKKIFPPEVNCWESGLSARMFIPLLALSPEPVLVTGEGTLLRRPFGVFHSIFPELGVTIEPNSGFLPFSVRGPLRPKDVELDGSTSSQFLTGLIMAYVAGGGRGKTIRVKDLQSKPYIDLTLSVLRDFGLPVPTHNEYREFYFDAPGSRSPMKELEYQVEGDWSSAAFILVAGVISGDLIIRGQDLTSTQSDRKILDILIGAGAAVAVEAKGLRVHTSIPGAFTTHASDCPDLFPPLVALASCSEGISEITGVRRLWDKESNRAMTLVNEFSKLGVKVEIRGDTMLVHGTKNIKGAVVDSHHDHRIAMALSLAALRAEGETAILHAEAVNKSFPGFYEMLRSLGASLTLHE
jgi:3-phosphoshikimate 1-carboxyvinyltransferase